MHLVARPAAPFSRGTLATARCVRTRAMYTPYHPLSVATATATITTTRLASSCAVVWATRSPAPTPSLSTPTRGPLLRTWQTHNTTALRGGAMHASVRYQGSLQSLLDDPSDPYLPAITDVDLTRIATIAEAGPRGSGRLAHALMRGQKLRQSPPPLASRSAQSEGEAVLQSLYEAGLERLKKAEAEAAELEAEARAAYDKLSDEEKETMMRERWVAHMFDGLCAVNAVLRMQIEDGAVSREELDAVYRVYELVQKEARPFASEERWQEDFEAELKELAIMFEHVKDARPIAH